jgi:hypothetical protein
MSRLACLLAAVALSACGGKKDVRDDATTSSTAPVTPSPAVPQATAAGPAVPTFADGKKPTRTIHVSPRGDDRNDGASAKKSIASLRAAVERATPGTAIVLHEGSYDYVWLTNVRGTADAPIWIGGAPGEKRPVFDGARGGIHIARAQYLVLHDIEVTGNPTNGINIDDDGDVDDPDAARFIVIRNVYIHDIGGDGNQDCLKLSGVNDVVVVGGEFARCGGQSAGSGIDMVGCHRGVIADSTFRDLNGSGVQVKGGSEDVLIIGNRIENGGARPVNMGGSTTHKYFRPRLVKKRDSFEARRIRVIGNQIVGGVTAVAFVGCVECVVANNTIVDPESWVLRILQETTSGDGYTFLPASKGRFVNNVIYYRRGKLKTHVNVGPDTAPETFTFASNLWFAHDAPERSAPELPGKEERGVVGQDPRLAAPPRDLRVCDGASPCLGAGLADPDVAATGRFEDPLPIGAFAGPPCQ